LTAQVLEATVDTVAPGKGRGAEPMLAPLGRGGFGEVWKCQAPGGIPKAIKFVADDSDSLEGSGGAFRQELESLEHIKSIRHPFMISMERVDVCDGELLIVMELADCSVNDVYVKYREAGKPGIPRDELLSYLREAAEVLDFMNRQHGLQHLDIKPHNLFLVSQHVKVADFGLVKSRAQRKKDPGPLMLSGVTPLYAAPEVYNGQFSDHSDQYSLAVTFQELLTGTLPFQGKNARQLMMRHLIGTPDLEALNPTDRAIVARALAKDPEQRFRSCSDFVNSLAVGRMVTPPVSAAADDEVAEPKEPSSYVEHPLRSDPWSLAPQDAVPGYHLLAPLSTHPLGDHWLVRTPDGRERWIQLLNVSGRGGAALAEKLRQLRHPALATVDILTTRSGRVYLVYDPFEQTLRERFDECRAGGLSGIPRDELLGHLKVCALALDELGAEYRLAHLCLQPRNVLLGPSGEVQLFQYGLTPLVWLPTRQPAGPLNSRYAAPELFGPGADSTSDQYSLAMIYIEMLTGVVPRPARSAAPVRAGRASTPASVRASAKLDLDWLPVYDRPVLTRALDRDPARRFGSCSELIVALEEAAQPVETPNPMAKLPRIVPVAELTGAAPRSTAASSVPQSVEQLATAWLLHATGAAELVAHNQIRWLVYPDRTIEHRYPVRMIPGALKLKLHDFPKQWNAQLVRQSDLEFVCRFGGEQTFWQRLQGSQSGIEVQVHVQPLSSADPQIVEAIITVGCFGPASVKLQKQLADVAPRVIDSIRGYLHPEFDLRGKERWPCEFPVRFFPIAEDGSVGPPQEGTAQNLAINAIGFCIAEPLDSDYLYVVPAAMPSAAFAVLTRVYRNRDNSSGGFYIGGAFIRKTTSSQTTSSQNAAG
jgi:serine/threonine protein kinase